jgi:ankyrin repeat protein
LYVIKIPNDFLSLLQSKHEGRNNNVFDSARSQFFLGVPHQNKNVELLLDRILETSRGGPSFRSQFLKQLKEHSSLNPPQAAPCKGNGVTVYYLVERGADVDVQGRKHGNVLQAAVYEGNEAIARYLVGGAGVTSLCGDDGNVLQAANCLERGHIVDYRVVNGAGLRDFRHLFR